MTYEYLLYEKQRHGVLITLNRPEQMNALNEQIRNEIDHALDEAEAFIRTAYGPEYTSGPKRYKTKSKSAQEAHEAVRPTSAENTPEKVAPFLSSEQLRLYTMIWKRTIASQMTDALFQSTRAEIHASGPKTANTTYVFRASGSLMTFPGFLALYREDKDDVTDDDDEDKNPLPPLKVGEQLTCLKLTPEQHFTQPPARFNDATLVKMLEEQGTAKDE